MSSSSASSSCHFALSDDFRHTWTISNRPAHSVAAGGGRFFGLDRLFVVVVPSLFGLLPCSTSFLQLLLLLLCCCLLCLLLLLLALKPQQQFFQVVVVVGSTARRMRLRAAAAAATTLLLFFDHRGRSWEFAGFSLAVQGRLVEKCL